MANGKYGGGRLVGMARLGDNLGATGEQLNGVELANMKKTVLGVALMSLLLAGCSKPAIVSRTENKIDNKKAEIKQTLKDLLASGVSQKCSWKFENEGLSMKGQVLMAGKKFKQEIMSASANEKETKMEAVSDGKYLYMWGSEMAGQGIKMEIKEGENENYSAEGGKVDWNKEYQYECSPTTVSETEFEVPKNIQFQDLGKQMEELKKLQEKFGKNQ